MNYKLKAVVILLSCFIIAGCAKSYSGKDQPKAINGVIDLSAWNFEKDGPVKLDGQWEFYWNSFIEPEAAVEHYKNNFNGYIEVPSLWTTKTVAGRAVPVSGYAAYKLKIIFPDKISESVSFRIPSVDSAFEFFIDNKMVFTNGKTGKTEELSLPVYYAPEFVEIIPQREVVLVFNISNFHYPRPGIRDSITIGDTKTISSGFEKMLVIDIFLIGAIFLMGMYHLGVYYLRRSDRSALYFALFCLSTVIRLAVTGEGYAYRFSWINWNIGTALEYILFYISVATCGLFMHSLYPVEITRFTAKVVVSVCTVFTLIVLIFPVMIYAQTLIVFNIFVAVSICFFVYNLSVAIIRKREDAVIFMFGSVILFLAILNDIMYNYRVTPVSYIMPYGLYSFFFVQSFILSSRFSKAFTAVEELSRNLEEKVAERTSELEVEKEKLKRHNMLMDKEVDLARIIQKELVPQTSPNDFISSLYKPMSKVGGDFFDFIKFRDSDKIGIFVSDVSGHGVPAAFVTSMIKTILIQAWSKRDNPAELLLYLNNILFNRTGGNFCTAFYGIYDPGKRSLTYSVAGHNKPYVITSGNVRNLTGFTGLPIGIMDSCDVMNGSRGYKNSEEILPAGSKLLLYTDGFSEARSLESHKSFEESILEKVLLELHDSPCNRFINDLYAQLEKFRGASSFDDDICLICLDVN